ncbi:60Kd inner membrane protein-domain-containing protein [Rhexocercosporidium sp. MPI-PUGE-AT-0058]|nr:60Kd inner membrane protein-domain-containing protein [Rhexocercosporidium sp. MPI-PUGE-AT-0058]
MSSDTNPLTESSMTIPSDSEQYSGNDDLSPSPPSSSSSPPMILYSPPTLWGLVRGAAINLLLPFINGLMLGFGELFAHEAAFRLGWGGTKVWTLYFVEEHAAWYTASQHRAHGLLSKNRASLPGTTYTALRFSQTNTLIRNAASIRFASTTPLPASILTSNASTTEAATSAAGATPPEFASEVSSNFTSSLNSATDFTPESLSNIPEHIGYLHELGLDYGWGPTSIMQYILEHIHVYTGTPWWVSISLTAIAMRALMFKPYIDAAENAARMQTIMPITKPLTTKMQEANKAGDHTMVMQLRAEIQRINKRAGLKLWKSAVPMLQVFVGYGTFVILRAMSNIPVPGLETGGFLWLYNLSIPDPYLILPATTAAVLHWVLRKGGDTGSMNLSPEMTRAMIWGLPAVSAIFTWWLPAAVQISFFVSGVLSLIQSTLFRTPWFRSYFKMTPLPARKDPNAPKPSPYRGDLKIAANPVLSQTELNSRFQGAGADEGKGKKGILGGVASGITGTVKDVLSKGREKFDASTESSKVKAGAMESKAYELRRQKEVLAEKKAEEKRRRAERNARFAARK